MPSRRRYRLLAHTNLVPCCNNMPILIPGGNSHLCRLRCIQTIQVCLQLVSAAMDFSDRKTAGMSVKKHAFGTYLGTFLHQIKLQAYKPYT